ncbi:ferredoxin--NADP+ reductase [Rhodococcus sp. SMB37]|uniref:FAD-dependent oxidoreductase n=1 Tax=Rhodococcus sp. SMB37 TaxID=2512213 RepID=UPI00104C1CB1|nr:FAD-dependent oxidoreductase [Rhodococcus sp. SMB37]TCN53413.1 ferredoxin--NADP+ reductase [Rhodococcus sp. SMB37]
MRSARIAVIGSGPAGLFAADELVRQHDVDVEVDIIDRVPAPYGLVRYGVAPDHPRIKSVIGSLQRILEHPKVRFLGNVEFGTDIDRSFLDEHYNATIYATGASRDRSIGIAGEELPGSRSATAFVSWYSGHPDSPNDFHLREDTVAVIGAGNVALDVARILAKTPAELDSTDMPPHVLDTLRDSRVRDIHVICRRGPEFAKFTTKELRELRNLTDADIIVDPAELTSSTREGLDRATLANLAVLDEFASQPPTGRTRRIHFHFWRNPVEIKGCEHVEGLRIERTGLLQDGTVHGTGDIDTVPAQLVLRSVGYRSVPLDDLPFDSARGVIPNQLGRVVDSDGHVVPTQYVTGWLKRGPSGVIGTNRIDSVETVTSVMEDLVSNPGNTSVSADAVAAALHTRGVKAIEYDGWLRINDEEIERGQVAGKDRTKIPDWENLRRVGIETLTSE